MRYYHLEIRPIWKKKTLFGKMRIEANTLDKMKK